PRYRRKPLSAIRYPLSGRVPTLGHSHLLPAPAVFPTPPPAHSHPVRAAPAPASLPQVEPLSRPCAGWHRRPAPRTPLSLAAAQLELPPHRSPRCPPVPRGPAAG